MAAALSIVSTVCAAADAAAPVQVRYMLWDSIQMPAYRQCAADFSRKNPGIVVKISQAGWGDYWTAISTGFIAGVAPDVFTNHLSKYPEFEANDLLVDLAPYIQRDKLDLSRFPQGLVDVWSRSGKQYGLPKDWDTVGILVNLDIADKAGVTLAELQRMTWNPKDGGSFEQTVRRLTTDTQGRNALDPAFDRKRVAVYGYQSPGAGGMAGQVQWSHFAVTNGFRFQDAPWSLPYHYDDPRLAEVIDWIAGLSTKGLSAPYQHTLSVGAGAMFVAGKTAMTPDGSWMITYFAGNKKFRSTWLPLPVGPNGRRASMLNGLSDSMWVGSRVKEQAWAWMKHLASPECQRVVAQSRVTFPASKGMADEVVALHKQHGVDASAFITMAQSQTFLMPIATNGAQVEALMNGAIESVLLGKSTAGPALAEANRKINKLFSRRGGGAAP